MREFFLLLGIQAFFTCPFSDTSGVERSGDQMVSCCILTSSSGAMAVETVWPGCPQRLPNHVTHQL